jgi:outer membrane protein TolC
MAAKALLMAQQANLKDAQTQLEAADERHAVGVATIADVLQAKTALSRARLALQATQGAIQSTRGALATAMGLPADTPTTSLRVRATRSRTCAAGGQSLIDLALTSALTSPHRGPRRGRPREGGAGAPVADLTASGSVARTYYEVWGQRR